MHSDASIIIPCYDSRRFVAEAVESCLAQSSPSLEVIVVDDGSTDDSAAIVAAIADRDSRVRLLTQSNRGLAAARNAGIAAASAPRLCFLDADDLLTPDKLEHQLALLAAQEKLGTPVGAVAGGHLYLDADGHQQRATVPGEGVLPLRSLLLHNPFHVNATLIERDWVERVGGFSEDLEATQDWDFHARLALAGCRIYCQPRPVLVYRRQTTTMASDFRRGLRSRLVVAERIYANPLLPPDLGCLRQRTLGLAYLIAALNGYNQGDFETGKELFGAALDNDPELATDGGGEIIGHLERWLLHPSPLGRTELLDGIFDHLPDNLPTHLPQELRSNLRASASC